MDAATVMETLEANHRNSAKHIGPEERALLEFASRYLESVTFSPKENAGRPPKIAQRLVPVVTEYLLTNRVTSLAEVLRFLQEKQGLSICRDTLNDLFKQYDLWRLIAPAAREESSPPVEQPPLFSDAPASPARG